MFCFVGFHGETSNVKHELHFGGPETDTHPPVDWGLAASFCPKGAGAPCAGGALPGWLRARWPGLVRRHASQRLCRLLTPRVETFWRIVLGLDRLQWQRTSFMTYKFLAPSEVSLCPIPEIDTSPLQRHRLKAHFSKGHPGSYAAVRLHGQKYRRFAMVLLVSQEVSCPQTFCLCFS